MSRIDISKMPVVSLACSGMVFLYFVAFSDLVSIFDVRYTFTDVSNLVFIWRLMFLNILSAITEI